MSGNGTFSITQTELRARPWEHLRGLTHAFSTRHESRERFFARVAEAHGLQPVMLHQVHSDRIHAIDSPPSSLLHGDALITGTAGLALVIKAADCLPVLLYDPDSRAIGAAHAGWRGTAQRIAAKTAGAMRAHYGAQPSRMLAVIGPGIQACCYEVGEEVIEAFKSQFDYWEHLLHGSEGENPADIKLPRQVMTNHDGMMRNLAVGRARLDLVEANRRQLIESGLRSANITTGAPCTACRTDLLYSYRREGKGTGRMHALIGLAKRLTQS